jgi:hypothetical protein
MLGLHQPVLDSLSVCHFCLPLREPPVIGPLRSQDIASVKLGSTCQTALDGSKAVNESGHDEQRQRHSPYASILRFKPSG